MPSEINRLLPREFPPLLSEIPDAPRELYLRGAIPSPDSFKFLCVVGSRAASLYARRACASLIQGLSSMPICIVSGLALGIDAEAHQAALNAHLPTLAVMPSGLSDSSIYPTLNRGLAARILKEGGALLSEYPPDSKAAKWTFSARNRIMAGLSQATVIVEASEKSGTLITARLALDYNRDVLAVPHPLGTEGGAGGNRLIHEGGARLIQNSEQILEALGLSRESASSANSHILPPDLTDVERMLLLALTEPLTRDELIERAALSAQHANIAISSLSLRGLLLERLGKIERV